jgi:hypothetical protein
MLAVISVLMIVGTIALRELLSGRLSVAGNQVLAAKWAAFSKHLRTSPSGAFASSNVRGTDKARPQLLGRVATRTASTYRRVLRDDTALDVEDIVASGECLHCNP